MNEQGSKTSIPEATASFSALKFAEKVDFLALLAHELTIIARDAYEVAGDSLNNPSRIRAINEVQHRLTSHLVALLKGDPRLYPDDVLVRIILEQPQDTGLQQQLSEAFDRAMSLPAVA